jgi:leucyl/phenylalanyl-tRNA--protein transferase
MRVLISLCLFWISFVARAGDSAAPRKPRDPRVPACDEHLLNFANLHRPENNRPSDENNLNGVVAIGAPLHWRTTARAISRGAFLMNHDDRGAYFVQPRQRAVMDVPGFKSRVKPRDLIEIQKLKDQGFTTTYDRAFERVVDACAKVPRWDHKNDTKTLVPTWISPPVISMFLKMHFHPDQLAHSVEVWFDGHLVGGLFISYVNGVPTGESMFFYRAYGNNIGKLALYALLEKLEADGHPRLDVQTMDEVSLTRLWGAYYDSRAKHQRDLAEHQALDLEFPLSTPRTR